ncbi:MAG: VWA domain-containing protein [Proteobacteria bacterium]|jgi:hypothetical protein|nr:VWA domain-containing protein [Pseudomonadota bacterium]
MTKMSISFFCGIAAAALGCNGVGDDRDDGTSDTDTDTDTDVDTDADSDTDADTESDSFCDELNIPIYNDPARVMLLMDHSSSMAGGNWDIARNAVYDLLTTFAPTSLEFGLDTFPDPTTNGCYVAAPVVVDCGPETEGDIQSSLEGIGTVSMTPLRDALNNFIDPDYAPGCCSTEYNKYIILLADGEDSCGGLVSDLIDVTTTLVSLGIRVIVIGFNVNMSVEQLNAIASNGGTTFTTYLNANDADSLTAAFNTIGTSIISCVFTIGEPDASANPNLVNFYFDDALVYMDEDCSSGSGWRWANDDHTQVEFCPDSCDLLGSGAVDEITATFGCDTIIE